MNEFDTKEIIQDYQNTYKAICADLTANELDFIAKKVSISKIKKKTYYLKAGEIQQEMAYLYKGLMRSYYIDNKGKEITISFIKEGAFVSDYSAFITRKSSKFYIQCLEPCVLVNLPYQAMQECYRTYKNFEKFGRLIAESILVMRQIRIESFLFENAEERYVNFRNENPALNNRVSLTHLASFLGIERQSLSRIRKKLIVS